jgi:hypothetical protein
MAWFKAGRRPSTPAGKIRKFILRERFARERAGS